MTHINRRNIAWVLLAVFALALAVSPICTVNRATHCCTKVHCPVCETAALVDQALHGFSWVALMLIGAVLLSMFEVCQAHENSRSTTGISLVLCKIRMNN